MHIRPIIAAFFGLFSWHLYGGEILPKGWLKPEQLQQAEEPIQRQLDTGLALAPTAWNMAAVKDARLLVIYLTLYERLPDNNSRNKLFTEQQEWLVKRKNAVQALADPKGGSMVSLDQASKHMDLTDKRIAVLQEQLDKPKK